MSDQNHVNEAPEPLAPAAEAWLHHARTADSVSSEELARGEARLLAALPAPLPRATSSSRTSLPRWLPVVATGVLLITARQIWSAARRAPSTSTSPAETPPIPTQPLSPMPVDSVAPHADQGAQVSDAVEQPMGTAPSRTRAMVARPVPTPETPIATESADAELDDLLVLQQATRAYRRGDRDEVATLLARPRSGRFEEHFAFLHTWSVCADQSTSLGQRETALHDFDIRFPGSTHVVALAEACNR